MSGTARLFGTWLMALGAAAAVGYGVLDGRDADLSALFARTPPPVVLGPFQDGRSAVNLDLADAELPGARPPPRLAPRVLVLVNGRPVYAEGAADRAGGADGPIEAPWRVAAAPDPRDRAKTPAWDAPPLRGGGGLVRISLGRLDAATAPARLKAVARPPARSSTRRIVRVAAKPAAHPAHHRTVLAKR